MKYFVMVPGAGSSKQSPQAPTLDNTKHIVNTTLNLLGLPAAGSRDVTNQLRPSQLHAR